MTESEYTDTEVFVELVYIGTRPFKMDAGDDPVLPDEVITADHPYATHTAHLLTRADFRER